MEDRGGVGSGVGGGSGMGGRLLGQASTAAGPGAESKPSCLALAGAARRLIQGTEHLPPVLQQSNKDERAGGGRAGGGGETKAFRLKGQSPPVIIFQTESLGGRWVFGGGVEGGCGEGKGGGGGVTSQQARSSSSVLSPRRRRGGGHVTRQGCKIPRRACGLSVPAWRRGRPGLRRGLKRSRRCCDGGGGLTKAHGDANITRARTRGSAAGREWSLRGRWDRLSTSQRRDSTPPHPHLLPFLVSDPNPSTHRCWGGSGAVRSCLLPCLQPLRGDAQLTASTIFVVT